MKFINYLKSIEGVSAYPLFTLLLFFLIFVLATVLIFSKSKKTIDEIKNIPFDEDNNNNNINKLKKASNEQVI